MWRHFRDLWDYSLSLLSLEKQEEWEETESKAKPINIQSV